MRLNQEIDGGRRLLSEYDSIAELAEVAEAQVWARYPSDGPYGRFRPDMEDWHGVRTPYGAYKLAREGWDEHLEETLELARDAVTTVETERDEITFRPEWSVSGSMVDMGAYLAGEPECMIEFPPARTSRVGRVITLCASIGVSGGITAEDLILKGQVITALALQLERLGMNTEMYADMSAADRYRAPVYHTTQRILVKGPNDVLDPAKVLFAYAHPAMLRVLVLSAMHAFPEDWRKRMKTGSRYGTPEPSPETLPEGTIYLPETLLGDRTAAPGYLCDYLEQLGLVVTR